MEQELTHKTPNGKVVTAESLEKLYREHSVDEVVSYLGYQSESSVRKLMVRKFNLRIEKPRVMKNRIEKGFYQTPSGEKMTIIRLKKMLNKYTLREVADKLGYAQLNSVKWLYKKLSGEEWVPKERIIPKHSAESEGMITYTTPNGIVLDVQMLNQMMSEHTIKEVAEMLGYQSKSSVNRIYREVFKEKVNRNNFSLLNNDREFLVEIQKFLLTNRYAPCIEDLVELTGHVPATIKGKIKRLTEFGYLDERTRRGNTISLTDKGLSEILPEDDEVYMEFEKKFLSKLNKLYK